MDDNLLEQTLKHFLSLTQVDGIPSHGATIRKGVIHGHDAELSTMFIGVTGIATGVIGETLIAIHYNGLVNKHSFKVSIDNRQAVIMDYDEIIRLGQLVF